MHGPFLDTQASRKRREAVARRRRARRRVTLVVLGSLVLLGAVLAGTAGKPGGSAQRAGGSLSDATAGAPAPPPETGQAVLGPVPLQIDLDKGPDAIRLRFKRQPRAGLLVDLDTGRVLWRRNPTRTRPIASVTKMMTALVAVDRLDPADKARISRKVLGYSGSGVGVLPRGKRVKVETLLNGLMLPSGNDAARALALRAAPTLSAFVKLMNARAASLGLRCTQFASVEGLSDRNRSCPTDLAALAKKVLDTPRIARVVRRRRAILPFPIKGGRIHMYNNNPLLRRGYPGVIGVKTGYTNAAGRCLVAAARRNGVRLAVILLDSPDPGDQARKLLDRGFRAIQ